MADPSETPLPRRFVLYFPVECPGGDQLRSPVEGILCERLGGVTSYPARGTFKMADGQRISENLQVLESFCESGDWVEQKPFLLGLAGTIGAVLKQESIACTIDGRMETVPPIAGQEIPEFETQPAVELERILKDLVLQYLASGKGTTARP